MPAPRRALFALVFALSALAPLGAPAEPVAARPQDPDSAVKLPLGSQQGGSRGQAGRSALSARSWQHVAAPGGATLGGHRLRVSSGMPGRSPAPDAPSPEAPVAPHRVRFIVELADAPLAAYAAIEGASTVAADARRRASAEPWRRPGDLLGAGLVAGRDAFRPDLASPASLNYLRYLDGRQAAVANEIKARLAAARVEYHYRVAFNGLAVSLPPPGGDAAHGAASSGQALPPGAVPDDLAKTLAAVPGVVRVTPEEAVVPLLDTSLGQIRAPAAWADARIGGRDSAGRGVRVALIDAGISAAHPFFTDTGFTAPLGFPTSTLTVGDKVYTYSSAQLARFTNQKVIVARAYANPETVTSTTPTDTMTPLADGLVGFHGAHTAGIAAGRVVTGGPKLSGAGKLTFSGVAPGAYLMAYKFTNAYTPEILRMIDDAVKDGADVINNSWGTAAMNVMEPDEHPIVKAFGAATKAGVVVVAAAGNSGDNGEATLGGPHQMSRDVITVANVQTGRTFAYRLFGIDEGLPAELESQPAVYWGLGPEYDVIQAHVYNGDLCNPLAALRARARIVLTQVDKVCPTTLIQLPIQIPGFEWIASALQQLATAGTVGAKAVVFYSDTLPAVDATPLIQLIGQFVPTLATIQWPDTVMISGEKATGLVSWASAHTNTLQIRLESSPASLMDPAAVDEIAPSSSQGPAPDGVAAPLKPDLAAPGTDILSTNTGIDGSPAGFTVATGTSMSSPHVAGAVAVLRQAWPSWSPADIKSALLTTADPVVHGAEGTQSPVKVQGAGRLDLARAIDPGILITPPSVNLGRLKSPWAGTVVTFTVRDLRQAAEGASVYRLRHEAGLSNTLLAPTLPDSISVPEGGAITFTARFQAGSLPPGDYDGWIVLEDGKHTLRVVYTARQPLPPKQVLLVNVRRNGQGGGMIPGLPGLPGGGTFTDTTDYSKYWTDALDQAGLSHDVWNVAAGARTGTPPLAVLEAYDLVIVAGGDGNVPLAQLPDGMTSFQMYLLGGGRMVMSGIKWPHSGLANQDSGAMNLLSRYFAGFELLKNDVAPAGPILPVRLFHRPVSLAGQTSADAAGNGGVVDFGQPLAALRTSGQGALDLGIAAPLVVTRLMPYMHSYLEVDGGGSVMTGVSADATLEAPARSADIPWRAIFAGFAVEAVQSGEGRLGRSELLRQVYDWATEDDRVRVTVTPPTGLVVRRDGAATASVQTPPGVTITGWRWDPGDGRPFVATQQPRLTLPYAKGGRYVLRAEATTSNGHTYVGEAAVTVGGPAYVPMARLGD